MSSMLQLQETMMSDDDIIQTNQRLRRRFINEMTADKLPDDPKAQLILLTALADMDRTALQNKKIGSTEKQGAADREAALLIAAMGTQLASAGQKLFEVEPDPNAKPIKHDASRLPPAMPVEGEMVIGISTETVDEFMARMDKEHGFDKK